MTTLQIALISIGLFAATAGLLWEFFHGLDRDEPLSDDWPPNDGRRP